MEPMVFSIRSSRLVIHLLLTSLPFFKKQFEDKTFIFPPQSTTVRLYLNCNLTKPELNRVMTDNIALPLHDKSSLTLIVFYSFFF